MDYKVKITKTKVGGTTYYYEGTNLKPIVCVYVCANVDTDSCKYRLKQWFHLDEPPMPQLYEIKEEHPGASLNEIGKIYKRGKENVYKPLIQKAKEMMVEVLTKVEPPMSSNGKTLDEYRQEYRNSFVKDDHNYVCGIK